jgi:catechol 2,3-dioxygenase
MTATTTHSTSTPFSIDPGTEVGPLSLTVADLGRSIQFYTEAIGMAVIEQADGNATLGVGATGEPLLVLVEQPGATEWPVGGRSYTGLYHFAILTPDRASLGLWLKNWLSFGLPIGQGDHLVSEALYLNDPDGHGIEVYRDRPRSEWQWENGLVQMATDPVDLRGLLEAAERSGLSWDGLPAGTKIGHIHLQVGDIEQAAAFYHGVLGFDIVASMPSALFISAGGYHHHIGMNIWHSRGAGQPPADSVRLRAFTVELPSEDARATILARLEAANIPTRDLNDAVAVDDPFGNTILLHVAGSAAPTAALLDPTSVG